MKKIQFLAIVIFVLFGLVIGGVSQVSDNNLHIVFCDVGQGDAIYMRTPSGHDVLVDGGPGRDVLKCLSEHMPFWDREIDVVVLTHPQADHLNGLISVLERYSVHNFVSPPVGHTTKGFAELKELVEERHIPVRNMYTGEELRLGEVVLRSLWPDRKWLADAISIQNSELSIENTNDNVLGKYTTKQDLNDFSIYFHIQMGDFDTLLTGDGDIRIQDELMNVVTLPDVDVLKVPHHGSRTGMTEEFLNLVDPEIAVISVGGTNRYGHPARSILELLTASGAQTFRTDEVGDVEVVSDGETWWMVSN